MVARRAVVALLFAAGTAGDTTQSSSSATTGNPVLDALLQFGPLGMILVAAALGYIWFKPSVEALKEDKRLLQEVNTKLLATYQDQAIPALHEAVRAMSSMAQSAKDQRAETASLTNEIREQRREISDLRETVSELKSQLSQGRGGAP